MSRQSYQRYIMYFIIAAFAAYWNWLCGNRGLFSFDQSFVLDAGTRILQGKEIYKDFYAPFGLVSFYYTAAFLFLCGNTWSSFVLAGCSLNALMAVLQTALIEACGEKRPLRLYAAGLLSALGSVAVFGTVYPEYLACVFGLTASLCLLRLKRYNSVRLILAAMFFALSYHSKQNVAIAFLPLLSALCVFSEDIHETRSISASGIVKACFFVMLSICAALIPLLIFYLRDSLSTYLLYAVSIPSSLGRKRIVSDTPELAGIAVFTLMAALIALRSYCRESTGVDKKRRKRMILSMLFVFHALFFSMFLEVTMVQDPFVRHMQVSFLVFLLPVLLSALILKAAVTISPRVAGIFFYSLLCACLLLSFAQSYYRLGQESVAGASFSAPMKDSFFDSLRWGIPTYTDVHEKEVVTQGQLEAVLSRLREHTGEVFIYPDFSSLYSASAKKVPHPYLWFHPGLTYIDSQSADATLFRMLEKGNITMIVLEKSYFDLRVNRSIESLEKSYRYILQHFQEQEHIGSFSILSRRKQDAKEMM